MRVLIVFSLLAIAAGCSKPTEPAAQATPAAQLSAQAPGTTRPGLHGAVPGVMTLEEFRNQHRGMKERPLSVEGGDVPGIVQIDFDGSMPALGDAKATKGVYTFADGVLSSVYMSLPPSERPSRAAALTALYGPAKSADHWTVAGGSVQLLGDATEVLEVYSDDILATQVVERIRKTEKSSGDASQKQSAKDL